VNSMTGKGAGWQASSYRYVSYEEGYVLWSHGASGKAELWQIDPSSAAPVDPDPELIIPRTGAAALYPAAGMGAPWQATNYSIGGGMPEGTGGDQRPAP